MRLSTRHRQPSARSVLSDIDEGMPRTVTTCHLLPLSVEEYLLIRGDPAYEAYKADLVHQELHITKLRSGADEQADPTRWRSVEIHFRENPVPPFLRSLVNKLIGKEIRLSLDEHAFATHSAFDPPPPRRKQHLPKAIEEILSVESSEWLEVVSPTQCELHLQHQVSCRLFGTGGAIEQAVEKGVRDGYGRSAELLGAYLRERGGGRGGGNSRDASVLVEATPDTAVSVGSLVRNLTEKLRFDGSLRPNPNPNPDPDPNPVPNQWKHERDERTRRASTDEARERVQNSDEAETAAAESAELGAPPSVAIAGGARELF